MTDHLDEAAGSVLLATAVAFVAAQPGGPARLSALHQAQPNGLCAGCVATPTRWPCSVARIAVAARTAAPLIRTMAGHTRRRSRTQRTRRRREMQHCCE
jgi:hypothetical protein